MRLDRQVTKLCIIANYSSSICEPSSAEQCGLFNYNNNNNNKANILRGGLQSPNGGFQEGPQKIKAKIQLKV